MNDAVMLKAIEDMIDGKIQRKQRPLIIYIQEICVFFSDAKYDYQTEIAPTLNRLYANKLISVGRGVNNTYITLHQYAPNKG